jgi:D-methionine transport system substrate-binding protein
MNDYVRPNLALADKELDANYFQHIPYLEKFAKDHKLNLMYTAKIHIEPMGIYSKKIKKLAELPNGAIVSIPNDPTNGGRALLLLEKAGIIKLKANAGITATVHDIADNPKKIVVKELEAPQLPRSFGDVTLAVINTNYALDAGLVPERDALFVENADSPYVNILVIRKGDENRPELKKLAAILNKPAVKKFIVEKYKGAIVPAF